MKKGVLKSDLITSPQKDIINIFQIKPKEFSPEEIESIITQLSKEELNLLQSLYFSGVALPSASLYYKKIDELWWDYIAHGNRENKDNPIAREWERFLKNKKYDIAIFNMQERIYFKKTKIGEKEKAMLQAEFLRKYKMKVPTNRTISRTLENLWDMGFLARRNPKDKRTKDLWSIRPKIYILLKKLWGSINK